MRKLYENFHIFHFHKRIVSAETIRGNTVKVGFVDPSGPLCTKTRQKTGLATSAQHSWCTVHTGRNKWIILAKKNK